MCCIPRPKVGTHDQPHHQRDLVVDALSALFHQQKWKTGVKFHVCVSVCVCLCFYPIKWGHALEYTLLFSPLKSSLHDETKRFLSIDRRRCSKQSSCYDYMPVLRRFAVFAWRNSPARSCGKWNISVFDLFVVQYKMSLRDFFCFKMRCAGLSCNTALVIS